MTPAMVGWKTYAEQAINLLCMHGAAEMEDAHKDDFTLVGFWTVEHGLGPIL